MFSVLIAGLLITGCLLLLSGSTSIPSLREHRHLDKLNKPKRKIDLEKAVILPIARRIAKFIRLNPYNKEQLEEILDDVGYDMTPEVYTARAYAAAGLYLLFACILFLFRMGFFNLFGGVMVVAAIIVFFQVRRDAEKALEKKRQAIEAEAPRFMRSLTQSLLYTRDILGIVDKYRISSGPALLAELDILVTEMKTGNHEQALLNFSRRVHIDYVTTFISGLVSQSKGIDQREFLLSTEQEMKKVTLERLKAEAFRQPDRLIKAQIIAAVGIGLIWLTAMGFQLYSSFNTVFHF